MAEYTIKCITRSASKDKHESLTGYGFHITGVGTTTGETFTTKIVIELIGNGDEFYVGEGATKVKVQPVPESKPSYIRTHGDDKGENNLLNLPKCE